MLYTEVKKSASKQDDDVCSGVHLFQAPFRAYPMIINETPGKSC